MLSQSYQYLSIDFLVAGHHFQSSLDMRHTSPKNTKIPRTYKFQGLLYKELKGSCGPLLSAFKLKSKIQEFYAN